MPGNFYSEPLKDEVKRLRAELSNERALCARLVEALGNSVSALCSLRKNYGEELPLWHDVSRFIREGNAALSEVSALSELEKSK